MGIVTRIVNAFKALTAPASGDGRSSRYDAAQTTPQNRNHWREADGLSGDTALSPDVRCKLRNRSRYEVGNNGYAQSLVTGRADDTVGTGPRLQLSFPTAYIDPDFARVVTVPPGLARQVEKLWQQYCNAIGFADDLALVDTEETTAGEGFAVMVTNDMLPDTGPQVDLVLYESDQCATPDRDPADRLATDGIRYNRLGHPVEYHFLNIHPGDGYAGMDQASYTRIPAWQVFHFWTKDRPSQRRGCPRLTPALPLFAQLRRLTLATLGSAELGAMISGVIEQDNGSPDGSGDDPPEVIAMETVPFAVNALMTLGAGQRAKGFDNNKPSPEYKNFKTEILTEAGRSIGASRNTSTGSSAEYNYSSGRLDHLPRNRSTKIRRERMRRIVIDPFFLAWVRESLLVPGYFPEGLPPVDQWTIGWMWDGFASIDPGKDASANETLLLSGQTTLADVCGERGDDWEEVLEQQAREQQRRVELGLPPLGPRAVTPGAAAPQPVADVTGGEDA